MNNIYIIIIVILGVISLFTSLIFYLIYYVNPQKDVKNKNNKFVNLYAENYNLDWYTNQKNIVLKCINEDCNYETLVDYPVLEKMYLEEYQVLNENEIVFFKCPICQEKKVIPLDFYLNSNYFKYHKNE